MSNINIVRVNVENLFILPSDATVEQARLNKEMELAVTRVCQIVVDGKESIIGLLFDIPVDAANDEPVTKYMLQKFEYLLDDGTIDLKSVARRMLNDRNLYLVPVIDSLHHLLYAYQLANAPIDDFLNQAKPRFSAAEVISSMQFSKKWNPGKKIYVCSNLLKDYSLPNKIDIDAVKSLDNESVVVVGFDEDYLARQVVAECRRYGVGYQNHITQDINGRFATDWFRYDKHTQATFEVLVQGNGRYFDWRDFDNICQIISQTRDIPGVYVEIGTYRGDSAQAALEYMRQARIEREAYFLDTYEGFSYDVAHTSTDVSWANTHGDTSKDLVEKRLIKYKNANFVKTDIIEDDLPLTINEIAVCNIDVDIYEAVEATLIKVSPMMSPGGVIMVEDFGHTPNLLGAQLAAYEFAEAHRNEFFSIYGRGSQLLLIRK